MSSQAGQQQIQRNVRIHDRIAASYESTHDEIFNDVEQSRLRAALTRAKEGIGTGSERPRALDFGCGSGNLTRHLLALGFEMVAADVSRGFLDLVADRHRRDAVTTYRLDGERLAGLDDASFDLVATYSVLHHVPDYLAAVDELARVTRPGGIVYVDHEHAPGYWTPDPVRDEFLRRARRFDWRKFLVPRNYYGKLRRLLIDPRHSNEGDIHVWPDDHIEWDRIAARLAAAGFEALFEEDYLVYRAGYRREIYDRYRSRCTDMRVAAYRKAG
jgi:ubiquinone/menaquinone biosynthesis C-methylase UbiE